MFNPFKEKGAPIDKLFVSWDKLYPFSYDKNEVDPYTRLRIILMNGTEYEANWFLHQFSRHCPNNDLRREVAFIRRTEQQQQKKIACLKPIDETLLETTIGYEQLAVDLTARLAQREPDKHVKATLDFALLEDFDHLYRYADLLEHDTGIHAEQLVGGYTEIMPGRPTIAHHRHPFDDIRTPIDNKTASPITKLNIEIITAAEQQTMNYYMNLGQFYENDIGRQVYQEIAMVEEEHVSSYGSLMDTNCSWLECMLMHEYVECYLYYSCMEDEKDKKVKALWAEYLDQELTHLHMTADLLKKYEKKDWQEVFTCGGDFPELLTLGPNIEYIRDILANTVRDTAKREKVVPLDSLPENATFFEYQKQVNKSIKAVPSHAVIMQEIEKQGTDYRFQVDEHPIKQMRNTQKDNTDIGRVKGK